MKVESIKNAIKSLYQMIIVIDRDAAVIETADHNKELKNLSETRSYSAFRRGILINIHPEDREAFALFSDKDHFLKELEKKLFISGEFRIRYADGRYYWSEITICNALKEDSTEGNDCLMLIRDIDERKVRELKEEAEQRAVLKELHDRYEELFEENMRDDQTGCYNRKGMKYYTDIIIDQAEKSGKNVFVCVADLNGLKHLNDTYGHAAGDEAIAEVSSELLKAAPKGSRIVRTGGDEFLLMAVLEPDSKEPDEMGTKLDKALDLYNKAHSNPYVIGVSYGWVFLPLKKGMTDLDEYIETADKRMYEMKTERDEFRRD
ncbi:MAG: sensor domain-containing diguanylate cyclase [Lachnospiraceae bacterium]|nr:sensor domain-containing diguanylate cyclase [Lachnospiraceae bacterium]